MIYVMSDPTYATGARLTEFLNPKSSSIAPSEKEFGKRVLAYYYRSGVVNQEFGTLGYEDEGHQYTSRYKKLF